MGEGWPRGVCQGRLPPNRRGQKKRTALRNPSDLNPSCVSAVTETPAAPTRHSLTRQRKTPLKTRSLLRSFGSRGITRHLQLSPESSSASSRRRLKPPSSLGQAAPPEAALRPTPAAVRRRSTNSTQGSSPGVGARVGQVPMKTTACWASFPELCWHVGFRVGALWPACFTPVSLVLSGVDEN